jgi:hypothetical protein
MFFYQVISNMIQCLIVHCRLVHPHNFFSHTKHNKDRTNCDLSNLQSASISRGFLKVLTYKTIVVSKCKNVKPTKRKRICSLFHVKKINIMLIIN